MKNTLLIMLAALVVLAACTTEPLFPADGNSTGNMSGIDMNQTMNQTGNNGHNDTTGTTDMDPETDMDETPTNNEDFSNYDAVIEVVEGELVALNTRATDPDGDEVELSFGEPLNDEGKWQTSRGDAGEYEVIVIASDGNSETQALVLLRVREANSAPVIQGPATLNFEEGDNVDLGVYTITDPDGDEFVVSYSGWMRSSEYRTNFDDAGEHAVRITAEDSNGNEASKDITVTVENQNRRPRLQIDEMMVSGVEGDLIVIDTNADDPDGDDVTLSFESPFSRNGRWQTEQGDAGTYSIDVTASDGTSDITRTVEVQVFEANRPPVIEILSNAEVDEGESIDLSDFIQITDPEGEDVTVVYSGWMNSETRSTDFSDAGTYTVTVTASDGDRQATRDVTVTVNNVNRPPVFIREA